MTDDAIERLLAVETIKDLKARYFRTLDTKDWEGFADVFTEDAVMEVPEAALVEQGRAAIVASVSGALAEAQTVHHGHMPEIEITGTDTARGIWAMSDYVEWPRAEDGSRVGMRGFGHYREDYVREGDGWRIARLRLDRLRTDPLV